MQARHEKNKNYIHHSPTGFSRVLREIIFGLEDGMVSTLGAVTGIAIGTQSHFAVVVSASVIVAVESMSMGVGSYLSNKSEREIDERKLVEEEEEIENFPSEEKKELSTMFTRDGWPAQLAHRMADAASKNQKLFLREMAYRELHLIPGDFTIPLRSAMAMYFSYILGGLIPVFAYIFLPIGEAMAVSIFITLLGLFILGTLTTKFTKRVWWRAGLEMLLLGGIALVIGFFIGNIANVW